VDVKAGLWIAYSNQQFVGRLIIQKKLGCFTRKKLFINERMVMLTRSSDKHL
jgi:hypothetical protein